MDRFIQEEQCTALVPDWRGAGSREVFSKGPNGLSLILAGRC